jgi:hypothetical protein
MRSDKAKLIGDSTNIDCVNSTAIPMLMHNFIAEFVSDKPLVSTTIIIFVRSSNYKNVIFILIDDSQ